MESREGTAWPAFLLGDLGPCANIDPVTLSLRDGRTLFGVLRSFDQFGNLVLQDTLERIYLDTCYGETERGVWIVRGENVALMGELDPLKENELNFHLSKLKQVDFKDAERQLAAKISDGRQKFEELKDVYLEHGLEPTLVGTEPHLF